VVSLAGAAAGVYYYVSTAPDRAQALFERGMTFMSPGKYPQAIEQFSRAIGAWDKHARAYLQRGIARQVLGQSGEALADFEQAAFLDPSLVEAYTARATIFRDQGKVREAINEFTKSIELRPTMDAYYQRGQLWAKSAEHAKAIEDYDRAISYGRNAPYVYRARAESRRILGDLAGYQEDRDAANSVEHKR
jgi:tetratricopeptide (TPR) repeat protein